jgi:endonuclease YncB( thermonuclease family)
MRRRPSPGKRRPLRGKHRRGAASYLIQAVLVSAVLAVLVVRFGFEHASPPHATIPAQTLALDDSLRVDLGAVAFEHATVERIIDGDTLVVERDGRELTVRLFGLQAPERGEACAPSATSRLTELLPAGSTALLHPGPRNDDGSRVLRYIFRGDGTVVDAVLVSEGLAEAWRRDGQLREAIVALEESARAGSRGCLWEGG